jgi:HPt (histidine-containing phosphotransfer) domain-containing protein
MRSLHEQGLTALGLALQARTDALLRSLHSVFEERSLHAALQARRQLAELRAIARFCGDAVLQQQCVLLQRALLALGPQLGAGVSEAAARPLLLRALQLRWQALALTAAAPRAHGSPGRAARLAPDLHSLFLQQVQRLLRQHAGALLGAGAGGAAQADMPAQGPVTALELPQLQAAAQLAGVLPQRVLLEGSPLQALLHWESHLLGPGHQPRARLLRALAQQVHALCEETAATAALRQSLETSAGPWSERLLLCLQQASVLLGAFVTLPALLRRCLQHTLRVTRLAMAWQRSPALAATSLPAALAALQLRLLLRLQDDLARLASGSALACAGLHPCALALAVQRCLRQQRPQVAGHLAQQLLGSPASSSPLSAPALAARWQRLLRQEHRASLRVLQAWQAGAATQGPAPLLDDGVTLAVQRLALQSLLAGEPALHELLDVLGHCLTLSRELQHDARDCLPALGRVLPFGQTPARQWQRERVLHELLRWEVRLCLQAGAGAAQLALSLARGLDVLPSLQLRQLLALPTAEAFATANRPLLLQLRLLASGARSLQVQRIAALSDALARVHEALAQSGVAPAPFLQATAGRALLEEAHAALRRGLNQAAARQETASCRDVLSALYDWLACHGEQAAGRPGFVQEAQGLLQQILHPASEQQRLHALHTLKGNAALYRCETLAELCHRSERALLQAGAGASAPGVREPAAIAPLLARLRTAVEALAGTAVVAVVPAEASLVAAGRAEKCLVTVHPVGAGLPAHSPAATATPSLAPAPAAAPASVSNSPPGWLARRLHGGLLSLAQLLPGLTLSASPAQQLLLQELLQEQLDQARQLDEDLHASVRVHPARLGSRLRRVLDDTAHRHGKVARLEIRTAGRHVPRTLLESLVPPLEHLLRNAVVHGIESPARRRASGKHECGRVRVLITGTPGLLQVGVEDDGCGVAVGKCSADRVGQGIAQGVGADVTRVSLDAGHGLGLAAVKAVVAALHGRVRVVATPGQGCCYWLEMPENSGLGDHHAMPV